MGSGNGGPDAYLTREQRDALKVEWERKQAPTRRIVCAANAYKNLLILGARHFDATMHAQIAQSREALLVKPSAWEQGFIDQHGVFLTREEAFIVAEVAGQIIRCVGGDGGKLFSENLY